MLIFLTIAPIISIALGLIIGLIVSVRRNETHQSGAGASMDVHLPDGEEYKNKLGTPERDNPTIAEQLDGRLTNLFPNQWEGIL